VLRTVDSKTFPVAVASLTFALVNGLTEVVWNPAGIDGHTFVILPLLIAGLARASEGAEPRGDVDVTPARIGSSRTTKPQRALQATASRAYPTTGAMHSRAHAVGGSVPGAR
jgi:hypothetical protein